MIARPRIRCLFALILGSTLFFAASQSQALTEEQIRMLVNRAVDFEKQSNWEKAREIYEALLSQNDPGLRIRDRYHQVLRRCWQVRRHQDVSYRKEVLSIEYAQAVELYTVICNTLLDGSTEKKKLDPAKRSVAMCAQALKDFERVRREAMTALPIIGEKLTDAWMLRAVPLAYEFPVIADDDAVQAAQGGHATSTRSKKTGSSS